MAAESRKQKDPCRITLRNVRLSYPNLFTARAFARGALKRRGKTQGFCVCGPTKARDAAEEPCFAHEICSGMRGNARALARMRKRHVYSEVRWFAEVGTVPGVAR